MTINLINTIRSNRTNTKVTPIELYGDQGKQEWNAFLKALYDWAILDTDETRDAAFAAGRVIIAHFNEELDKGRKIRFEGVEDMLRFRDSATKDQNVDTPETQQLKAIKAFCRMRTGEAETASFTGADYKRALKIANYTPTKAERDNYDLPLDVAKALVDTVDDMLDDMAENKTVKQQEKRMVGLAQFRKACENRIAEKIDKVMLKTAEQIEQERKEKNKARRAAREKAAKKAAKQAAQKSEQKQDQQEQPTENETAKTEQAAFFLVDHGDGSFSVAERDTLEKVFHGTLQECNRKCTELMKAEASAA